MTSSPKVSSSPEIQLNVGGQLFSIDKELLVNSSEYFGALLSNRFKEQDKDIIKINRSGYLFSKIVELLNGYSDETPEDNVIDELKFYQIDYSIENEIKENKIELGYENEYLNREYIYYYIRDYNVKNIKLLINLYKKTDEFLLRKIKIYYYTSINSNNFLTDEFNEEKLYYYLFNEEIEVKDIGLKKMYKFNFIDKKEYYKINRIEFYFEDNNIIEKRKELCLYFNFSY